MPKHLRAQHGLKFQECQFETFLISATASQLSVVSVTELNIICYNNMSAIQAGFVDSVSIPPLTPS